MRAVSSSFRAHLMADETALCRCWLIMRRDGKAIALTEHDQPLIVHGRRYEPGAGLRSSAVEYNAQLAQDGMDVLAAFDTQLLTKADLQAGRYDGARMQLWLVNWKNPRDAIQLNQGYFKQVRQQGDEFHVELDGPLAPLHHKSGRVFQRSCDAQLGDARCGVDLFQAKHRYRALLHSWQSAHKIVVAGGDKTPAQYLVNGYFYMTTRPQDDRRYYIRSEALKDDPDTEDGPQLRHLDLWTPFAQPENNAKPDLTFVVGCDKTIVTCAQRFNNVKNFRGYPFMPGEKILVRPSV